MRGLKIRIKEASSSENEVIEPVHDPSKAAKSPKCKCLIYEQKIQC